MTHILNPKSQTHQGTLTLHPYTILLPLQVKAASDFHKSKRRRLGLHIYCKACCAAASASRAKTKQPVIQPTVEAKARAACLGDPLGFGAACSPMCADQRYQPHANTDLPPPPRWGLCAGVLAVQADEAGRRLLPRQVARHRAVQLLQGLLRRQRGAEA